MNATRAGRLGPSSLIVLGVLMAILASIAAVQTRGITASPGGAETSQFEPKVGQLSLEQPPYCTGQACVQLNAAITLLTALRTRFAFLAPMFDMLITLLVRLQTRLSTMFP